MARNCEEEDERGGGTEGEGGKSIRQMVINGRKPIMKPIPFCGGVTCGHKLLHAEREGDETLGLP